MAATLFDRPHVDLKDVTAGRELFSQTYRSHKRGISLSYECDHHALDLSERFLLSHIRAVSDAESNEDAMRIRLAASIRHEHEEAVYVIGERDADICKIGRAKSPASRLSKLRDGHDGEIRVHALLWIYGGYVDRVEKEAHRIAARARLHGEWFMLKPQLCARIVLEAARSLDVRCADSKTVIANWSERARVFAAAQVDTMRPMHLIDGREQSMWGHMDNHGSIEHSGNGKISSTGRLTFP